MTSEKISKCPFTMPRRISKLPQDHRGFPVPWFVAWISGKPDFRVIDNGKIPEAYNKRKCWVCGEPLGAYLAFVIGPMCAINRTTAEPPSHRECAEFSVRTCPFLTKPKMKRNEKNLPEGHVDAAGIGLERNPGVSLIWITKDYKPFRAPNGVLFTVGEPVETLWFAEGRKATRQEILASIESGFPLLRQPAEEEGPDAVRELKRLTGIALQLVPRD